MAQYSDKEMTDLVYFILERVSTDPKNASMRLSVVKQSAHVGERSLHLKAINEEQRSVAGRHIAGLRLEIAIDGRFNANLTSGAVGVDGTVEEAQKLAASEWYLQFGSTMIAAIAEAAPDFRIGRHAVHAGPIGLRLRPSQQSSQQPPGLPTPQQLLTALGQLIPKHDGSLHSVLMTLVFEPSSQVNGEIRVDGAVAVKAVDAIRQLKWPRGDASPIFYKQGFVLR